MKLKTLAALTNALLYLLLAAVLFCMGALFVSDGVRDFFGRFYGLGGDTAAFYAILLMAGLMALWILAELILVMRTVTTDPFVERNARAFTRMGAVAEAAGLLFIAKCFAYFTPMTAVCAVVMVLCGLFSLTLSAVFKRAVEYKRENDLTI